VQPVSEAVAARAVLDSLLAWGQVGRNAVMDVLDGTPVIDIKPYVPDFDIWPADRVGWFEGKSCNATTRRSDDRFVACSLDETGS